MLMPTLDLNHWRFSSTRVISATGASQILAASSVKSSKISSGTVSSTEYCQSTFNLCFSFLTMPIGSLYKLESVICHYWKATRNLLIHHFRLLRRGGGHLVISASPGRTPGSTKAGTEHRMLQPIMNLTRSALLCIVLCGYELVGAKAPAAEGKKLNNIVSELLGSENPQPDKSFSFSRSNSGWICFSAKCQGTGKFSLNLDKGLGSEQVIFQDVQHDQPVEIMRYLAKGEHELQIQAVPGLKVQSMSVKAIPELIHCGLGFNSAIKSYGLYDMQFLKKDILPNITTLIVPQNIELPKDVIDAWHVQGKKFVAEVGINGQAKTDEEHARYWTSFYDKAPFVDGIIINEFIINNPSTRPSATISPERQKRMEQEQGRYQLYGEAMNKVRADDRYKNKTLYAYFGGSGKKLNQ